MQQQIGTPKPDFQAAIHPRPEVAKPRPPKNRLSGYRLARLAIFLMLIGFWIGALRAMF